MSFYAYIHCKPDGTPFYVGKGNKHRAASKVRDHNTWYSRTVNKYGKENILVGMFECSDEKAAYQLEVGLIKRIRAMGVSLCNLTTGGDGGYRMSEESCRKIAEGKKGNQWNVGRKYSLETKIKKSRSKGGSPIECSKDGVVLVFPTLAEACKALGLDSPNVINHMKRKSQRRSRGIKGWQIRRVKDDSPIR